MVRCPSHARRKDLHSVVDVEALLASAITGVVALGSIYLTGRLGSRQDRQRWERDEKRRAYGDYLAALDGLEVALILREATDELTDDTRAALAALGEAAPRLVRDTASRSVEAQAHYRLCRDVVMLCAPAAVVAIVTQVDERLPTYRVGNGLAPLGDDLMREMRRDLGYPRVS